MLKKIKPLILKIVPIAILVILAFTYRDFLRSMILVPLAYLILIVRLISQTIGQQTLWISFVVFSIIIASISLAMRREVAVKEDTLDKKYVTQLQVWLKSVQRKERSKYFQWNLSQDLSNLLIDALAYRKGISCRQVLRQLEAGNLNIPPDIQAYITISQKPFGHTGLADYGNRNWLYRIWKSISRRSPFPGTKTPTPLDLEPEVIIRFLEDYLEIDSEIWNVS